MIFTGKDVFGKAGKKSVIMKKVQLPIVDSQTCQRALQDARLGVNFRLDSTFICAGGVVGKDTCQVNIETIIISFRNQTSIEL